ncbi:hypothetical protein BKK81_14415 [Cupriavidus sp. USMAHM13]|uniref:EAL domain-containing protein n=1 Tax=Cupriavidus malaysiensis TaxID=367825 RepID=A0ABN4TQF5_9BURK|nr:MULTISPECIES: EAL domain-containing protein [Cupriavidus]AOZ00301.1 hypothetical protein BKK81_14415 [Cupriavidus sp. USMAHM13]AOZ07045.1 hypothetical protein BKK80_15355 [Cupriavidus malaysiensis]
MQCQALGQAALEQAVDAVVVVDAEGRVVLFNAAAQALWECIRAEAIGRAAAELGLPPEGGNGAVPPVLQRPPQDGGRLAVRLHTSRLDSGELAYFAAPDDGGRASALSSAYLDHAGNPVLFLDLDGYVSHVNRAFTSVFGLQRHQAVGRRALDLMRPARTSEAHLAQMLDELRQGTMLHREALLADRHGRPRWFATAINPLRQADGAITGAICTLTDISDTKLRDTIQRKALEALAKDVSSAEMMDSLCRQIEAVSPGVLVSVVRIADGRLRTLAAPGLPAACVSRIDGLEIGPTVGSCGTAAHFGKPVLVTDIASDPLWAAYRDLVLPHGLKACWSTPIKTYDGQVAGVFALYFHECRGPDALHRSLVDVGTYLCALALERDAARERIERLAYYDPLTGLPNRQLLLARLDDAVASARATGQALAVLFIDIDDFKRVNEADGHAMGDRVLGNVAARLAGVVGQAGTIGRLGGDEFGVVLPDHDLARAKALAEALLAALAAPPAGGGQALPASASIGASALSGSGCDGPTLLKQADLAMYQAKKGGGHQIGIYDVAVARRLAEHRELATELRAALANGTLQQYYQPQIRLADGRLCAVEALARWFHPQRGEITPSRFIPLAEEEGLITALGKWAIEAACAQLAQWRAAGVGVPRISVNLSPIDLRDPALPGRIEQTLARHGLVPADLIIEITESVFLEHSAGTGASVAALRRLGVPLSIDDFGTGFSTLSRLMRLPVDEIKLDRSFLVSLETSAEARTLVEAVIRIGRSLDLTVVAEGVSSTFQHRFLATHGCQVGQGFLFSRAVPATAVAAWPAQWPLADPGADAGASDAARCG